MRTVFERVRKKQTTKTAALGAALFASLFRWKVKKKLRHFIAYSTTTRFACLENIIKALLGNSLSQ